LAGIRLEHSSPGLLPTASSSGAIRKRKSTKAKHVFFFLWGVMAQRYNGMSLTTYDSHSKDL
jgi:hypothetical protein